MDVTSTPILSLTARGLTVRRDQRTLFGSGVDCEFLGPGLRTVHGPNGSGKSTFLEVFAGLRTPSHGSLRLGAVEANDPRLRRRRRFCPSRPALFPYLSVRDHLSLYRRALDGDTAVEFERVRRYQLTPWLDAPVRELSTGNTQKLWLLVHTVGTFDYLALDEPSSGLDAAAQQVLHEEVHIWAKRSIIVLVDHEHAWPESLANLAIPHPADSGGRHDTNRQR
ncbi:ABC transporter ATP-binding protein [Humidisolicoccus flavus]|uniref:ABC transporter ATP-binding protein n=1 Tax=Humidisolicoccus flavus TaxID=3111414 RepID=UPI00324598F4